MTALGRSLVAEVVTRYGVSAKVAEQVVGFVLEQCVADLQRCRVVMACDEPVAIGIDTAAARLMGAADRIVRRKVVTPGARRSG